LQVARSALGLLGQQASHASGDSLHGSPDLFTGVALCRTAARDLGCESLDDFGSAEVE
jgi:hypothetical protein